MLKEDADRDLQEVRRRITRQVDWIEQLRSVGQVTLVAEQELAELKAALKRHPNMLLADWNALGASSPAFLANDGLHLNSKGAHAMALLIASEVGIGPAYGRPTTTSRSTA